MKAGEVESAIRILIALDNKARCFDKKKAGSSSKPPAETTSTLLAGAYSVAIASSIVGEICSIVLFTFKRYRGLRLYVKSKLSSVLSL